MKRLLLLATLAAIPCLPAGAQTLYLSQDVPTDPGAGVYQLPWEVWSYSGGAYNNQLTVPGGARVDAVQRLDQPGHWLFSLETPDDLAGLLAATALPRDVLRFDGANYFRYFCGGGVVGAIPIESNVDALYVEGNDAGDLVVSFDVPTTIAGVTYEAADLVRYKRTGAGCTSWQIDAAVFDASAAGAGIVPGSNVVGADEGPGTLVYMVFDVPTALAPSLGPADYLPGQVAGWDSAPGVFSLHQSLPGWPLSSEVDAFSCQGNPGRVPFMHVNKSAITAGDLTVNWQTSCSQGAENHAIYEGFIGAWWSHVKKDCFDDFLDNVEEVAPSAGSTYYLVVPQTQTDEGSYGRSFIAGVVAERPHPVLDADRCQVAQNLAACP